MRAGSLTSLELRAKRDEMPCRHEDFKLMRHYIRRRRSIRGADS